MIQSTKKNTKFKIGQVIRNILLNDSAVHALVENRIYPLIIPKETNSDGENESKINGNCIIYGREQYSVNTTKMGIYDQQCQLVISCISLSYDESLEIAESVFNALQRLFNYKDEKTNCIINSIEMIDSTEDVYNNMFLQTLLFQIR